MRKEISDTKANTPPSNPNKVSADILDIKTSFANLSTDSVDMKKTNPSHESNSSFYENITQEIGEKEWMKMNLLIFDLSESTDANPWKKSFLLMGKL